MGYIRGVIHGGVAGTILGICIAPQQGKRTREQLSAFGHAAREGYGLAEKTVRSMAPFADAAVRVIKAQITTTQKNHSDDGFASDDNIKIHHQTNGHN